MALAEAAGGWYGGAASSGVTDSSPEYRTYNGGGSSYIYTPLTAAYYPSGCLLNEKYYLTAATTISGKYEDLNKDNEFVFIGRAGNGLCRITVLPAEDDVDEELFLGVDGLERIYLADNKIKKAFLGDSQIFPAPLTIVEYIQSTGEQFIDTGIIPTANTRVVAKFQMVNTPKEEYAGMFGAQIDSSNTFGFTFTNKRNVGFKAGSGDYMNYKTTGAVSGDVYEVDCSFNSLVINGSTFTSANTWSKTMDESIYIFARNAAGEVLTDTRTLARLYYFKIYEGETLVRDYLPAIDNKGIPGLYDREAQKMYYSRAGRNFKIPQGEKFLDYVQTDGNCYFNTGINPDSDMEVETAFLIPTPSAGEFLYGGRNAISEAQFGMYVTTDNKVEPRWGTSNLTQVLLSSTNGSRFYIHQKADKVVINNDTWAVTEEVFSTNCPMYIFAMNTNGTIGTRAVSGTRLYYFIIKKKDGTILKNFRPYIDSNGNIGLYDLVSQTVVYNQGTGTLTI